MRKTLATVLLGTTLLTAACSNKSADMRPSTGRTNTVALDQPAPVEQTTDDKQESKAPSAAAGSSVVATTTPTKERAAMAGPGQQKIMADKADGTGGEAFHDWGKNPWIEASKDHLSTFAADVDTASYTIARRKLEEGTLPPAAAIRVEEFVNYFKYSFPAPVGKTPFSVVMEAAPSPLQAGRTILRVGVATKEKSTLERKPAHLVFLVDVSGSMSGEDRLGLAKKALAILTRGLTENDTVSLVTYAGDTRIVLKPTNDQKKILDAIDSLQSAGSTGMASGIDLAYQEAMVNMKPGTISRVIVLTDGDANVGPHTHEDLLKIISGRAKEGVTLSTIGFGMGNYKDELMEQLADKGNGNNFYIDSLDAAKRVFQQDLTANLEVVAKDVKLQVDFDPAMVARYRLVGYENRDVKDEDFRNDKVDAGEIGAGHQVTALYEVELTAKGQQAHAPIGAVRIRHKTPEGTVATEAAFPMVGGPAASFANSSVDFRFAFAAAAFADVLRGGQDAEHWSLASIRDMAKNAAGDSKDRKELVGLIEHAIQIKNRTASR
ncbi:MAG TPA: von Willebrand factor type A domain-containing protein [Kofleriaceae bacterium]|nr:von Willebrand factor type A domain-containing protein [Kofleriaceae bacterium]